MSVKLFRFCSANNFNNWSTTCVFLNNVSRFTCDTRCYYQTTGKMTSNFLNNHRYCFDNYRLLPNFVKNMYFSIRFKSLRNSLSAKDYENKPGMYLNKKIVNKELKEENYRNIINFLDELSKKDNYCDSDWEKAKELILKAGTSLKANDKNVETLIMKFIAGYKNINFAKSYLVYLRKINRSISPVTASAYLKLMDSCYSDHIGLLSDDDLIMTETLCNEMLNVPLLESKVTESLIFGLCLTKQWRESLKVKEKFKQFYDISPLSYSAIVKAAFRNNEHDFGIKLLEDMMLRGIIPHQSIYTTWLESSKDKSFALNSLLTFLSKYNEDIYVDYAKVILKHVLKLQIGSSGSESATITRVSDIGVCKHCKKTLKSAALTAEEFDKLKSSFLNSLVIGKNVFLKTNPQELVEYQEFLRKTAPFDFVLDGLNIAYAAGMKNSSYDAHAHMLKTVVKHFAERNKKVLILGRNHMKSWPKSSMQYIERNANVFFTENISEDDPYLLYAALYGGLDTYFVSRDMMRGHKYVLGLHDRELNSLFWRWQCTHQYIFIYAQNNGKVILKEPVSHLQSTHYTDDGKGRWHVPCKVIDNSYVAGHKKVNLRLWLCLPAIS